MVRVVKLPIAVVIALALVPRTAISAERPRKSADVPAMEEQITNQACGHILTNVNVWSPDSQWIVYDTRSDPFGDKFDGRTIEVVNVKTREVRQIYQSEHGAHCGVATFSPAAQKIVHSVDPKQPIERMLTIDQIRDESVGPRRLNAQLVGSLVRTLDFFRPLTDVVASIE